MAAAVRFVRGYLAFQAGRLAADEIPASSTRLRSALLRQRTTPAQRRCQPQVIRTVIKHLDAQSARVTVSVHNRDEALTYPLLVDLRRRRGGRWTVTGAGDDA